MKAYRVKIPILSWDVIDLYAENENEARMDAVKSHAESETDLWSVEYDGPTLTQRIIVEEIKEE